MFGVPPSGGLADNPMRNYVAWLYELPNKAVNGLLVVLFTKYNH